MGVVSLSTHAFSSWPRVSLIQAAATPVAGADIAVNPLMTDRLRGCKTNFHRQNDLSVVLLLFRPWPWVIIFRVIFWFDRRSLVEWNGKSNDVPVRVEYSAVQVGRWWIWLQLAALLCPRGQSAAVRRDAALPNTSPQVLAGSRYSLLSGPTAVASLAAVHTLWESAQYIFTLHHSFCLIPTSAIPLSLTQILKCSFELAAVFF